MREVRAGQVYLLPDGRELFVKTDPQMAQVRGRWILSVDTVTERINRSGLARFEKLTLIHEDCCFRCWYLGSWEDHEPPAAAVAHHEEVKASSLRIREMARARREAKKAAEAAAAAAQAGE